MIDNNGSSGSTSGGTGNDGNSGDKWGNPDTLQDHYNRHGSDFGATSPQDYAQKANNFYNNRGSYQVKTDSSGVTRVYDAKTNTFGSYNPDGTTKTFFKPSDFQAYFDRQPGW